MSLGFFVFFLWFSWGFPLFLPGLPPSSRTWLFAAMAWGAGHRKESLGVVGSLSGFLVFLGRGLALDAAMARGLGEEGIGFPAGVSVERKDLCSVERFRAEHSDFSAVSDVLCLSEP